MELKGWRKQWRKVWENPTIRGNPNAYTVWGWLLDHVCWEETQYRFGGKIIVLQPGQIVCGSLQIARETGVRGSTVRRTLARFASEQLIEQRTDYQSSLITVKNWTSYQDNEQGNEQRMDSEVSANGQRVSTNKEDKILRKKESNTTVGLDVRTESLWAFIDSECNASGIANKVNKRALDIHVRRHQTLQLRNEVRKCLTWLIERGKKDISAIRLGNWFAKAAEINKRDELRHLEWQQAHKDPIIAQKAREAKVNPEKPEVFSIDPAIKARLLQRDHA
jgi:hypothetical protein